MFRAVTFLAAAVAFVSLTAAAQIPPTLPGAVTAELKLAQETYQSEVAAAAEGLLKEFAAEENRILDSTKLKIDDKIKRSEAVQDEKKAFEADGKLPKSLGLKVAAADYQAKVVAARSRCEKAFDKAAESAGKTDLAAAKAVLASKIDFFKPAAAAPPPAPAVVKPLPGAAGLNPLVGTWQRPNGSGTMFKHVTPTHAMIVHHDATGRVVLTHGGAYTLKGDTIEESIDYGFGAGWDALKNRTVTHTYTVQGGKWTCKGPGGRGTPEVWELVGRK